MSLQELEIVRGILRDTDLAIGGPVDVARANFEEMLTHLPLPEGVDFDVDVLGGVPAMRATDPEVTSSRTLLYLHGGAFAVGSANGYRAFWGSLARTADAAATAIDYRLAPEHLFPAAVDDALAAYRALLDRGHSPQRIAVAGDSAGGGLVVSLLVAAARDGLPMPGCGVCLSPWSDLTCSGATMEENAEVDLSLDAGDLRTLAGRYAGERVRDPLASPALADLTGLPPLLIQVGSVEILLDDAVTLARSAGAAGVRTTLEVWPGMPHVWHSFGFMLSEGAAATSAAGEFIRRHTA